MLNKKLLSKNLTINKSLTGFTLIELLVVIAIIALLASLVIVGLSNSRAKARDARRIEDIHTIAKAFELYYTANFSYPTISASGPLSGLTGQPALAPTYLASIPSSQIPKDGSCAAGPGNSTNDYYMYANGPQANTYSITFCLGGTVGAFSAGPHTLTQGSIQ